MARAGSRARAAGVLLWLLAAAGLLWTLGGLLTVDLGRGLAPDAAPYPVDTTGLAGGTREAATNLVLLLGVPTWALLAWWSSWSNRAARAAGRGELAGPAGMAWYGLFVPLANLALPIIAYASAARFIDGARHARPGRLDPRLIAWWVLLLLAMLVSFYGGLFTFETSNLNPDRVVDYGIVVTTAGSLGTIASVLGALALRTSARDAREAATTG